MSRKLALSFVFSILLLGVTNVFAGWIWADPEWNVAGTHVLVDVAYKLPNDTDIAPLVAESPVTLIVPNGVPVTLINDHGMVVHVEYQGTWNGEGNIPIRAHVDTPATYSGQSYDVRIKMEANNRKWQETGASGQSLEVSGWVPGN